MLHINPNLICMNLAVHTKEEAIRAVIERMVKQGYVDGQYYEEVLEREKEYPTGLPSEGVMTAVPHAYSKNVKKSGVGVAQLKTPVLFQNMADKSESLPVELVFVMANHDGSDGHVENLQELMQIFSNGAMLLALKDAQTAEAFAEIFAHPEKYEDN